MRYVIKYTDGAYNQGCGFTCTLEEATVYGSQHEAERVASELCDVEGVFPYELAVQSDKGAVVSFLQLADAIEAATVEIEVCVPTDDYYRRPEDWTQRSISVIDPAALVAALRG